MWDLDLLPFLMPMHPCAAGAAQLLLKLLSLATADAHARRRLGGVRDTLSTALRLLNNYMPE